jgi:ribosome-associated protein
MPEALADAIRAARKITSHEGKRRQMQFVGKVMRGLDDDEVAAIRPRSKASRAPARPKPPGCT